MTGTRNIDRYVAVLIVLIIPALLLAAWLRNYGPAAAGHDEAGGGHGAMPSRDMPTGAGGHADTPGTGEHADMPAVGAPVGGQSGMTGSAPNPSAPSGGPSAPPGDAPMPSAVRPPDAAPRQQPAAPAPHQH